MEFLKAEMFVEKSQRSETNPTWQPPLQNIPPHVVSFYATRAVSQFWWNLVPAAISAPAVTTLIFRHQLLRAFDHMHGKGALFAYGGTVS